MGKSVTEYVEQICNEKGISYSIDSKTGYLRGSYPVEGGLECLNFKLVEKEEYAYISAYFKHKIPEESQIDVLEFLNLMNELFTDIKYCINTFTSEAGFVIHEKFFDYDVRVDTAKYFMNRVVNTAKDILNPLWEVIEGTMTPKEASDYMANHMF